MSENKFLHDVDIGEEIVHDVDDENEIVHNVDVDFTYFSNDEDDEDTIKEEEALEQEVTPDQELQLLAKDLGLTVEELKSEWSSKTPRRSRCVQSTGENIPPSSNPGEDRSTGPCSSSSVENETPTFTCSTPSTSFNDVDQAMEMASMECLPPESSDDDVEEDDAEDSFSKFYSQNDFESDDEDYMPQEKMAKTINVGNGYQADIPNHVSSEPVNGDQDCLWVPRDLTPQSRIGEFVQLANTIIHTAQLTKKQKERFTEDVNLQYFMQSDYNIDAAIELLEADIDSVKDNAHVSDENEVSSSTDFVPGECSEHPS